MNGEMKRVTGKEPLEAVGLKEVGVRKIDYKQPVEDDEVRLPPGVQVRYLLAPGEYEGGDNRRATDPIWSLGVYDLERSVVEDDQPVSYYLDRSQDASK